MKALNAGDIVIVNLDPTVGQEKQKTRVCVVLEPGGSPLELMIVAPITEHHSDRSKSFFVRIPDYQDIGLTKPSAIDCYQIRTVSLKRIKKSKNDEITIVGAITKATLDEVKRRLALILDITEDHITF